MAEPKTVEVNLLGRSYRVACDDHEREALMQAVAYLDAKMNEIRKAGKVMGAERIAVMAALNISNEFLQNKQVLNSIQSDTNGRARHLTDRIMVALAEHKQLKL